MNNLFYHNYSGSKTFQKEDTLPVIFGAHSDATVVQKLKLNNQKNELSLDYLLEFYKNEKRVRRYYLTILKDRKTSYEVAKVDQIADRLKGPEANG